MNQMIFGACMAALLSSVAAHADANLDLAKEKGCMSCHALRGEARHAPSFRAIASKYRNRGDAETILEGTVMKGNPLTGGYHWGLMPEPVPGKRPSVSQAEARQLVQWVLRMQ
jgi:cytochrome c